MDSGNFRGDVRNLLGCDVLKISRRYLDQTDAYGYLHFAIIDLGSFNSVIRTKPPVSRRQEWINS